jgi:hypothetical protein
VGEQRGRPAEEPEQGEGERRGARRCKGGEDAVLRRLIRGGITGAKVEETWGRGSDAKLDVRFR